MLDACIKKLQEEMELTQPLSTEFPGSYVIPLEEGLAINISSLGAGGCVLSCNLTACPKQKEDEFFTLALLGNLFGQGTGGAILGLNDEGNLLTLTKEIDYNVEYKDFKDILEDFINSVDFWRQEVVNHQAKTGQAIPK